MRQRFDRLTRFRKKFFESFQKRRNAPEKHSRVPLIRPGADIFLGDGKIRFFREAANGINGEAIGTKWLLDAFYIAVSGFRACRGNSQNHHASFYAGHFQRHVDDLPIGFRLRDVMIGGQHRHHCIAFGRVTNVHGRKRNGCRGISSARFRQNFLARRRRQLFANSGGLLCVCH